MKPEKKYEKLEKIGQGSFGKVYKVRNRSTKEFLCLKEIDLTVMSPKMRKDAENEVKILKTMRHEYILKFIESYKTNGNAPIAPPAHSPPPSAPSHAAGELEFRAKRLAK